MHSRLFKSDCKSLRLLMMCKLHPVSWVTLGMCKPAVPEKGGKVQAGLCNIYVMVVLLLPQVQERAHPAEALQLSAHHPSVLVVLEGVGWLAPAASQ